MSKAPAEQLLPAFLDCLSRFPPVFHNFFLEAFRAPAAWFEARARYTRSIAVSSMAGYVIGLGESSRPGTPTAAALAPSL